MSDATRLTAAQILAHVKSETDMRKSGLVRMITSMLTYGEQMLDKRALVIPSREPEAMRFKREAYQSMFGHEAVNIVHPDNYYYQFGGPPNIRSMAVSSHDKNMLALECTRRAETMITGVNKSLTILFPIHVPIDLIMGIFNEMEWADLSNAPPRRDDAMWARSPRPSGMFVDSPRFGHPGEDMVFEMLMDHRMAHGPSSEQVLAAHQKSLEQLVADGKVKLVPTADGKFTVEIEGLTEKLAAEKRAKEIAQKRANFASWSVAGSDVFSAWANKKLDGIKAPVVAKKEATVPEAEATAPKAEAEKPKKTKLTKIKGKPGNSDMTLTIRRSAR